MSLHRRHAHAYPCLPRRQFIFIAILFALLFALPATLLLASHAFAQDATAVPIAPKAAVTPFALPTKPQTRVATSTPEPAPTELAPSETAAPENGAEIIVEVTASPLLTDTTSLPPEQPGSDLSGAGELPDIPAPIAYTPAFAEIDCPFVTPWSQTIVCGALTVPEVRSNPESAQIDIFVMILKSPSTPLTDPIVVLPGGPGSAGSQSRNLFYGLPSHRNRDVILIDPRGTGHSYPSLDCFEMNAIGITHATSIDATRACYERLQADGRDLAGYVSSEQVHDVVDLAKVLGFGKINLYATSYGTRVAVLLADKFPALVRSMVLDGVLPVAVNSLLEEPLNDYGAIQRIAQDCVAVPLCNGSFPALEARLLEVIDRYNRTPMPDDIGYGSGDAILKFIFKQMYAGGGKIPAFITALFYEDYAQACALLPPAVGCFFAQADAAADGVSLPQSAPTQAEAMLGIDFIVPEVGARQLITWARVTLAIQPLAPSALSSTAGTTSAPAPENALTDAESDVAPADELSTDELSTDELSTDGVPPESTSADQTDTPPWRAHFTRPEDPLGPDLDRISWLMHDRGFARPEALFAWLDALSEEEVIETLSTIPDANFDTFSEGAYASVICAEEAPFYTLDDIAQLASRIPQQFGSLPTWRAQEVKEICAFWQVPPVSAARKMTLPSSVPTLLTNGTHDAVTPAVWAERAAIYLNRAWLRLFPGYGHAILSTGDICMQEMMDRFIANPNEDPTPQCFRNLRIEFEVP